MKAWQMERELMQQAVPRILSEEDQTWSAIEVIEDFDDQRINRWWYSEVPGSGAPERLIIGAIQAMENKGYDVTEAEAWIGEGLTAWENRDLPELHRISSKILQLLNQSKPDLSSPYWQHQQFTSWEQAEKQMIFIPAVQVDLNSPLFEEKMKAGWLGQIIGGAIGTAMEGYTTDQLKKTFGRIDQYIRTPNTFNDDITFELAFLKAFDQKGYQITSVDIADQWVALIPFAWSAEDIALRHLKNGVLPPVSGQMNNYFNEWIGAQMRGAICGMAAPGNPGEAARLAWIDGCISHHNNGIMGELFNAMLTATAFVEKDIHKLVQQTIESIPLTSEYGQVLRHALEQCRSANGWEEAWAICEKKYERYNWIHAYPNAAAEVVALWYGDGSFDKTMNVIALAGQDVDCNAAQIGCVLAIAGGLEALSSKWTDPIGDELNTYVRGMKQMTITGLSEWTVEAVRKAVAKSSVQEC